MKNLRLPPSQRDRMAAAWQYLVAAMLISFTVNAQELSWDANAPLDSVTAYKIYYGYMPADRQFVIDVGNVTSYRFSPAFVQNTYFAITAVNATGESGYSNEAAFIVDSTATVNICDCDRNGKAEKLDYAKMKLLSGTTKFLSNGTLNVRYNENYDFNKDEKIDGLDRLAYKKLCP